MLLNLVYNTLALLLSLVNDIVDLKLIREGKFVSKMQSFCPGKELDLLI